MTSLWASATRNLLRDLEWTATAVYPEHGRADGTGPSGPESEVEAPREDGCVLPAMPLNPGPRMAIVPILFRDGHSWDALPPMDVDRRHALARAPWKTRTSRAVYENPWMRLREDIAEMPDGRTTIYGVVQCKPAVGVLPFLDDDIVVLVGQYRYVFHEFSWEMPTGAAHPGETLEAAARRELVEEAAYEAADLVKLCDFQTSKSIVEEVAHIYVAKGLRSARGHADPTEFIEVRTFPFEAALEMVQRSEIKDSMTVVAILHAALRRGG